MLGKISLECSGVECGESASLEIIVDTCPVYMLFFRFNTSCKELFVSCNYSFLFVCLTLMIFKVNA